MVGEQICGGNIAGRKNITGVGRKSHLRKTLEVYTFISRGVVREIKYPLAACTCPASKINCPAYYMIPQIYGAVHVKDVNIDVVETVRHMYSFRI